MTMPSDRLADHSTDHSARPAARAVSDYSTVLHRVRDAGLLGRRYGFYAAKGGVLLAAFVGVWVGVALLGDGWIQLVFAAILGIVVTQMLFLGHDAAHRQIFRSGRANEWTALVIGAGFGGISLAWWTTKHTRHHRAPNQIGADPDISSSVLRFYATDNPPRRRLARVLYDRQGWWFFPLLLFEALHLHARSVYTVLAARRMKRRGAEAALLVVRLGVYPAVLFTLLPANMAAGFLAVQLAVTGMYLGTAFASSHIGMPIVPADVTIDFLRRQVLMSRNIAGGRPASFAMGGLNYQVEHHLFPSMPLPNLRRARPIVQAFCTQQDVSYQEIGIHRALMHVTRHLNRVGLAGASDVACPTAAALR